MRVRMVTLAASPAGVFHAGEVWEFGETEARALVAGGYAVALDPQPAAAAPAPVARETTDVAPNETAALRRAPKRRPAGSREG